MLAWELLKHLEEGGSIYFEDAKITLADLSGWDYDPIRDPNSYSLTKPKEANTVTKTPEMSKETQKFRIKTWGLDLKDYVWSNNNYLHKSVAKGKK